MVPGSVDVPLSLVCVCVCAVCCAATELLLAISSFVLSHFISAVVVVFLICLSRLWMHFANRDANDAPRVHCGTRCCIRLYQAMANVVPNRLRETTICSQHINVKRKQEENENGKCADGVKLCATAAASSFRRTSFTYICYLWFVKMRTKMELKKKTKRKTLKILTHLRRVYAALHAQSYRTTDKHTHTTHTDSHKVGTQCKYTPQFLLLLFVCILEKQRRRRWRRRQLKHSDTPETRSAALRNDANKWEEVNSEREKVRLQKE